LSLHNRIAAAPQASHPAKALIEREDRLAVALQLGRRPL